MGLPTLGWREYRRGLDLMAIGAGDAGLMTLETRGPEIRTENNRAGMTVSPSLAHGGMCLTATMVVQREVDRLTPEQITSVTRSLFTRGTIVKTVTAEEASGFRRLV